VRWGWPFWIYVAVSLVHLVRIAFSSPGTDVTKALLMPSLLLAVALVVLVSGRSGFIAPFAPALGERRRWWGIGLLAAGIVASFLGDLLLGVSFVVGLGCFALAHVLYVIVFNGPARSQVNRWWSLVYIAVLIALVVVLWPHLGELRPVVVGYGVVLALTAITSTRVNAITAWGGGLFLASDSLLAFRLFYPDFRSIFPDPWQDLLIMGLYCAGEGLIALGVIRRLGATKG